MFVNDAYESGDDADDEPYYGHNHAPIEHPTWFTNISVNGQHYWWIRCKDDYELRGYSYWRVERSPQDPVMPFEFLESLMHMKLFDDLVKEMNSYLNSTSSPLVLLESRRVWLWNPPVVTQQIDDEFEECSWEEVHHQLLLRSRGDALWLPDEYDDETL